MFQANQQRFAIRIKTPGGERSYIDADLIPNVHNLDDFDAARERGDIPPGKITKQKLIMYYEK